MVSEPIPVTSPPPTFGTEQPAPTVDSPATPKAEDGSQPAWAQAEAMGAVSFVANRDSAILVLPEVANARDYRVFRVPSAASVSVSNGAEQLLDTTVHCAGYRQHNAKDTGVRELLRIVEVTNLTEPTTLVVEAIDSACPYTGALVPTHADIQVPANQLPPEIPGLTFGLFTDAELRAKYGSLILNGHGKGPTLASQAPAMAPKVLARTAVKVTPAGKATPRTRDFFDDFDGTSGPIVATGLSEDSDRAARDGRRFSNSKWDFFIYNDEDKQGQLSEERGLLHVTLPDYGQDVFATMVAVPRAPVPLSNTTYLHLTFEVASNATSRRYWWVGLCGAGTAGQTFDGENHFAGHLVQTSFFYEPDGLNVSTEGWNCLQFFPRDGSPFGLGPEDTRTESDVRVMVNTPDAGRRESVVNVSPPQYPSYAAKPSWFRMQDANGTLAGGILDDQLLISPRTRFDAYVRRDRLILYVNGQQRLCNDFPNAALSMAEGAVAFGQVLYHSAAEHTDFTQDYNDRSGQKYYLDSAAFVDERDWDNVGYESLVSAPSDFDPAPCYRAP